MKVIVINREINVNAVKVVSISGSSVFLVGDTQMINCSSAFESVIEYASGASEQVQKGS
ncbi:spore gernimation protein GerPD [Paenibacillus sp. VTT E-133280]|uniref:spore gernimation protein GerPD n=1 Tax=Paenibacillus sp. VTT E-133280 TaxID=1986222 RepID=UPI00117DCA9B|nr:spore gernimation protein GerPD [Paenibacillus sp. VTT E-133280]